MKKTGFLSLAVAMTLSGFPAVAEEYRDYRDGDVHANHNAYQDMLHSIDNKYAAEKPSNPTYLQQEPVYDAGNYGDINGQKTGKNDIKTRRNPLTDGSSVFVSKEVNAAKKEHQRNLQRGHDKYFQPVREQSISY